MIPHSKPTIGPEEQAAAARAIASGRLAQGPEVEAFEAEAAAFAGRRYGVAVSSGTAALHLALDVLGIGPGDPVAMPSYACAALAQAALWLRAVPVPCDIGDDYNLDPAGVPAGARAVVLPHLFGAPARVPEAPETVEDLAQALGAEGTGRIGRVSIASFYATKLITSGGEGGMLLTGDPALAEAARDRRDYDGRDTHRVRYAYKMTEMQAAVGRVQLRRLPDFIARRRALAAQYRAGLAGLPLRLAPETPGHVYFRLLVATPRRDALQQFLADADIEAKPPVYRPLHHALGGGGPESERAHRECLSIPIYPALTSHEAGNVLDCICRFHEEAARKGAVEP